MDCGKRFIFDSDKISLSEEVKCRNELLASFADWSLLLAVPLPPLQLSITFGTSMTNIVAGEASVKWRRRGFKVGCPALFLRSAKLKHANLKNGSCAENGSGDVFTIGTLVGVWTISQLLPPTVKRWLLMSMPRDKRAIVVKPAPELPKHKPFRRSRCLRNLLKTFDGHHFENIEEAQEEDEEEEEGEGEESAV